MSKKDSLFALLNVRSIRDKARANGISAEFNSFLKENENTVFSVKKINANTPTIFYELFDSGVKTKWVLEKNDLYILEM